MENITAREWEYDQKHKECSGLPTLSTIRYKVPGPGGMRTPAYREAASFNQEMSDRPKEASALPSAAEVPPCKTEDLYTSGF